jgi:hypothetical protein
MTDPIVVEFEVNTSAEHAFAMWTSGTAIWWPRSHTVSRDRDLVVVFEPFSGGRIFERARSGGEHEWGVIRVWEPPRRVEYLWHIFVDRRRGTDVSVTFTPTADGTVVRLVHSGFDRLADDAGPDRLRRTRDAWAEITKRYADEVSTPFDGTRS